MGAAEVLPPPPMPASDEKIKPTTLDAEGVTLAPALKDKITELAEERDDQLKVETTKEVWQDLFDRARQLFREAALPRNVARLLTRICVVRRLPAPNCETVIARVLAKAQTKGYEAALQELEGIGISAPTPPK